MLLLACAHLTASVPKGYYDRANGLKKVQLKLAMHDIAGFANVLSYGGGEGKTWTGFYVTDRQEDGKVTDRYSYDTFSFSWMDSELATNAVTGMNIEHSFPKSWWGGTENQSYKDLFNLMPSESTINNSKSNNPMGIVDSPTKDNGCTKVGSGTGAPGTKYALWEPGDEWKGDFARTYFYMVTVYSHLTWSGDQAMAILENNDWPTLQPWAYSLYLDWARQDPVSDIERERNEAVFGIQGNRNPFIDFPNLVEYIWGDSTECAFTVPEAETLADSAAYSGLMAFQATELVSSIYSCRFDANWNKPFGPSASYMLDVYTKGTDGNRQSLAGYPRSVEGSTYRVSEAKASTTYYYQVSDTKGELVSNEVKVDMPKVTPSFNVSPMQVVITSVPGQTSDPVEMKISLMATSSKVVRISVEEPFEISDNKDAMNWQHSLELTGANTIFYVRLTAQEEEGEYRGIISVSLDGMPDKRIPIGATVDAAKSFFEDFETGSKGKYDAADVKCSAATWHMDNAMMAKDANANDLYAVRIKGGGYISMTVDKTGGCDSLWFNAGLYNKDTGMAVTVTYSTDGGANWNTVTKAMPVSTWKRYAFHIGTPDDIRLKFEAVGATTKRINVDDIQMSDMRNKDDEDGITDIAGEGEAAPVYDLTGRRLHDIPQCKGIYIIGTRKVVCSGR